MNFNINDEEFSNSLVYQNFLKANPKVGYLKLRAYTASEALPVKGVKAIVTTNIAGNDVIFFEGETDASGMIKKIALPVPSISSDNLLSPPKMVYDINISYLPEKFNKTYKVNLYENITVIQTINIPPYMEVGVM